MERRVPALQHTREAFRDLIEGRLALADARTELIRLATQLIAEEAMETERNSGLPTEVQKAIFSRNMRSR